MKTCCLYPSEETRRDEMFTFMFLYNFPFKKGDSRHVTFYLHFISIPFLSHSASIMILTNIFW